MPVKKVPGGYRWGQSGKVYPTKAQAEAQGRAIFASGYREKPYGVRVMLSEDFGRTWKKDMVLFTGVSSDLGYPCTVEQPDGSLLTVFYAKDAEPGPAVIKQQRWELKR